MNTTKEKNKKMKPSTIIKSALTCGLLLTAPLTLTAQNKVVNVSGTTTDADNTYHSINNQAALTVHSYGLAAPAVYSGTNITLISTATSGRGQWAFDIRSGGVAYLYSSTILSPSGTKGRLGTVENSSTITIYNLIAQGDNTAGEAGISVLDNGSTLILHSSTVAVLGSHALNAYNSGSMEIYDSFISSGTATVLGMYDGGSVTGSNVQFISTGPSTGYTVGVNAFGGTLALSNSQIQAGAGIRASSGTNGIYLENTVITSGSAGIDLLTTATVTIVSGTINSDNSVLNTSSTNQHTVNISGGSELNGNVTNSGSGTLSVNLGDSTLAGNIITSGSSATTIDLTNSTLTGASGVSGDAALTVNLDNDSTWNLTAQSSLTTLNNSGTLIIANALGEDLTVSGVFTQDTNATLDVTISGTDPIITAGTASINGTLRVAGFVSGTLAAKASEIIAKNFTLIHTTDGIGGEFSTTDFGLAASTVDYVTLTVGKTNSDRDYALNYSLSWFAASSTSHGNFTIASGTSFEIDITLSDTTAGAGAGGWDGKTLTKLGGGLLIVSSSNNFTGGALIDSGEIYLTNLSGLGSGTVSIENLASLRLGASGIFANNILASSGTTIIDSGASVTISGSNTLFTGTAPTVVNGALFVPATGDFVYQNALTGSGALTVNNSGAFNFAASTGAAFTGTVELQNNTLALTAANALPLSNATLVTGSGNLVIVDSDPSATSRNIGGLSFSGGTIRFEGYDPHATVADTIITVTDRVLNVSGGGAVEVVVPNPSQIPDGSKFTHIPLLQQDEGLALTQLVSATNGVTGDPSVTLELRDDNGRIISDSYTLNLSHDGITPDAIGTYDYGLNSGTANDGLYIAFQLKQVDIQAGRTLTLDQDTPTPAEGDDFSAKIIGAGNLNISAASSITLNGTGNSYSGTTTVSSGTLIVGADYNMFASSTAFVINSGAALNTNGYNQQVNNLTGSGLANFENTTLTVNNSSSTTFSGTLSGGALVKDGAGLLNANDAKATLTQVQIDNGSLLLGANATVSASGQPAVLANGGTATFNASSLSTSGSVLILAKDNSPATVNLNNMTVSVAGNFVEANNGALTVTLNDSTATGKTAVANGGALNLGLNNSVWNLTGKSKLTTLTSSGGTITIDNVEGEDLTVSNGITGQTALNLTLSDSVKGDQEIWVVVDETNNMTGERFTLSHEVSYGMYNYNLVNANDGAWLVYTGSSGTTPPPLPPGPPTISDEGDTIINTAAAVAGFWFTQLDNLHKRMGELRYNKPATGDALDNIWVRAYGQQINANTGITSVKGFSETQYGVDLGTDYLWKLDADNQLYTGVFAGYGGADRDFHTNYSGNTDSGYGGVYVTWLNKDGWYADVVAKGQYFRNDFSGADRGEYDSLGLGFSVEFGRQFEFKDGWFAEPSVQVSYLHLMNDNYTTRDGMGVTLSDADVLHIYGGARFGRNIKLNNSGLLQPYIKAGGLGQISSGNKLTVSGDHWRPNLDGARAVVGAGLIWQLDADSQLHLDYEASFGEKYDKPWGVNLGYRYQF